MAPRPSRGVPQHTCHICTCFYQSPNSHKRVTHLTSLSGFRLSKYFAFGMGSGLRGAVKKRRSLSWFWSGLWFPMKLSFVLAMMTLHSVVGGIPFPPIHLVTDPFSKPSSTDPYCHGTQEQIHTLGVLLTQRSPQGSTDLPVGEYTNNTNLWKHAELMVAKETKRPEHTCLPFIVCFRS